ncbi:hypothetical protein DKG77_01355 [Flagellimonas aquimarina]|jgi:hypothetical protein|uniref:Anti-sigma factor n=1 Tax=Flagellimonas aquimarina TaxID=2201895 RepID=A0A316KZ72_9FLAO|nr:hypothetical protein [Allomuricauda koreensis]PWL39512.1 hypothetical protein DKG77_01355 [Allomuricauda koreensis]
MDNFEKYIKENKEAFNIHKVDKDKLWQGITSQLEEDDQVKVIPLWKSRKLRVAASIILLLGLSLTTFLMVSNPVSQVGEGYASEELLDIDMYYKNLVYQQVQLVKNHPTLAAEDKEEFLSFMDELDYEYEQLRLEMQNNLDNELVLEAIVNNYKKRIELIENLLKQINASKNETDYEGYIL